MKSPALTAFLAASQGSTDLQQRLSTASNIEEFAALAHAAGHAITARECQLWANCDAFHAPYWPWAGLSPEQRLSFFRG